MANDEMVLEVARAIRLYLPALLGDGPKANAQARTVDQELAELLTQAQQGHAVEERILGRLRQPSAVHNWAASFLQYGLPPDVVEVTDRSLSPLPGRGSALAPLKYVCPQGGDTVWYRRAVGQPVPECPTHHVALDPVGRG
jgi:hypothetical protein